MSGDRRPHRSPSFNVFRDEFESIEEVQDEIVRLGLTESNLIVAVDFTASNEDKGEKSFEGMCLHSMGSGTNPYITVMSIMCKTLGRFDKDQLIPAYGFGDSQSRGDKLFSFSPNNQPVHRLEGVLEAYRRIAPVANLSGPTNFAPAIYQAMNIVRQHNGEYHILIIIADGEVTSQCVDDTVVAIQQASQYALSIIVVGVGDGPWDRMEDFDDGLQATERRFDNFQFVNFTQLAERLARQKKTAERWEASFAVNALMEIPHQYQAIRDLRLLGRCPPQAPPQVTILPPPQPRP